MHPAVHIQAVAIAQPQLSPALLAESALPIELHTLGCRFGALVVEEVVAFEADCACPGGGVLPAEVCTDGPALADLDVDFYVHVVLADEVGVGEWGGVGVGEGIHLHREGVADGAAGDEGDPVFPLAASAVELVANAADEAAARVVVEERAEGRQTVVGYARKTIQSQPVLAGYAYPSLLDCALLPILHAGLSDKRVAKRALPASSVGQHCLAVEYPRAGVLAEPSSKHTVLTCPCAIPHHAATAILHALLAAYREGGLADGAVSAVELHSAVKDCLGEAGCVGVEDVAPAACLADVVLQAVLAVGGTGLGEWEHC